MLFGLYQYLTMIRYLDIQIKFGYIIETFYYEKQIKTYSVIHFTKHYLKKTIVIVFFQLTYENEIFFVTFLRGKTFTSWRSLENLKLSRVKIKLEEMR